MKSVEWMVRRYTGAQLELSDEEMKQLEARARDRIMGPATFWWFLLAFVAIMGAAVFFGGQWLGAWVHALGVPVSRMWCQNLAALVIAVAAVVLWVAIFTHLYVRPMRQVLREMGHAVCVKCGYWLRELPEEIDACPECGASTTHEDEHEHEHEHEARARDTRHEHEHEHEARDTSTSARHETRDE